MNAPAPARLVNLPNVLTSIRLALVPIFVIVIFLGGGDDPAARWVAGAIFTAAAITDRYDGRIARRRGQVTNFGKIADPIADKALIGATLISLSILGEIYWWITIVILVREIGITLLRFAVIRYGVIAASWGGKAKTLVQMIGIGLYVLPLWVVPGPSAWVDWPRAVLLGLAIALTIATGADYLVRAAALVTRSRHSAAQESR